VKLLFVGDVVGKPGRRILGAELSNIIDQQMADYVVVNIENAAGGFGITYPVFEELQELPIDCYSTGNHVWDKREIKDLLVQHDNLLRPANYPEGNAGVGVHVGETAAGIKVATINLEGRVFMKNLDSPFKVADQLIADLPDDVKVIFVDFHAEATSEKQALGLYLDGRVSAVVGTHTHVPTADHRVLPEGTAFITDVGMTGPYLSVIGMRHDKVIKRFLLDTPSPFEVAKRDVHLAGVVVDIDETTGKARSMERIWIDEH
jgi:metallophosphoesterase (TIGR00282 family)